MIVDSSALVAIVRGEPDQDIFLRCVQAADVLKLSAASYVEVSLVVGRRDKPSQLVELDALLDDYGIAVVPFTVEQALLAREAHQRFGRGSGHPAKLNFGDCFSYALARATGEPLLFKGEDFAATDGIRFAV